MPTLPSYDELPVVPGAPKGSSWGLWGPDDRLGALNLLTPEAALAGAACVRDGAVFNLNLELELPGPPLFRRERLEHVVKDLGTIGHDDLLVNMNTQSSSQWDGFRHMRHPVVGHYNGIADEEHGVHFWARRGLVGRAVLADVERWRASAGRPIRQGEADVITVDDLQSTLDAEGVEVRPGDVLLLRTGWLGWYRSLDEPGRQGVSEGRFRAPGLERGRVAAAALWNLHISAVAADNPAVEGGPPPGPYDSETASGWRDADEAAEAMLHFSLLGLLGIPIGEMFDLDALAEHCAADGRYTALFTSAPLNLQNGVASPPNALAVK
ncbi:MAG: cyclase family protein [Acidimicrobiaceae bacterium]|nr:cyclase family protein [Acidimicrobiaceae bacterium]